MLAEKNVKAEEIMVDLATGAQKKPDYLKLNPGGYVPTLVHDGYAVPESTVICEYLDEVFPEPTLKPADAMGRASMRWWTRLIEEALHPANSAVSIAIWMREGLLKQPPEARERGLAAIPNPGRREWRRDLVENGVESMHFAAGLQTLDKLIGDMNDALAGKPWLAGTYSLADIGFAVYVNRIDELQLGAALFGGRSNVVRWLDAVRRRDNWRAAVEPYQHAPVLATMKRLGEAVKPRVAEVMKGLRG